MVPFLRLRGRWLEHAGFREGDQVQVEVEEGRLVITPIKKTPTATERLWPQGVIMHCATCSASFVVPAETFSAYLKDGFPQCHSANMIAVIPQGETQ